MERTIYDYINTKIMDRQTDRQTYRQIDRQTDKLLIFYPHKLRAFDNSFLHYLVIEMYIGFLFYEQPNYGFKPSFSSQVQS
jgi:hypothetical protein